MTLGLADTADAMATKLLLLFDKIDPD